MVVSPAPALAPAPDAPLVQPLQLAEQLRLSPEQFELAEVWQG